MTNDRTPARLALVVCLFLAACAAERPQDAGNGAPQRIVVVAPAAAEILEALGLLDRVVGIGEFGPWPRPLADRPLVGGYASPNVERVLELRADLVLTTQSEAATAAHARLEALGVRVVALDTSTYDGVFESLERMGRLFGRESDTDTIASRMRAEIEEVRVRARGAPPRRVLCVVGRDPLYVAGPGSHLDELIRLVGGENVAADAAAPYQQFSLEAVLERLPQVIVDSSDNRPGALRGRSAGAWGEFGFLPAVEADRVYWIDPGRLAIPGLRLPEMARLMGELVQPELFGEARAEELE
jgi:ABC-type Fe3+-hydroxamate transport system substrate-binding protein